MTTYPTYNKTEIAEAQVLRKIFFNEKYYYQNFNRLKETLFNNHKNYFIAIQKLIAENKKLTAMNIHSVINDIDPDFNLNRAHEDYKEITSFDSVVYFLSDKENPEIISTEDFSAALDFLEIELKRKLATETANELFNLAKTNPEDTELFLHKKILSFIENKPADKQTEEHIEDTYKHIERIRFGDKIWGIESGISDYDNWTGGFHTSDLNIIAGHTSQGKTTTALTMMFNASTFGKAHCSFFSLEMSNLQITARLQAIETGISSKEILGGKIPVEELRKRISFLKNNNIHLPESRGTSLEHIISMMRYYCVRYNCKVHFIDYLQLITNEKKGMNTEMQLADICRTLKNFAKENDVCVNLLSQLSRDSSRAHGSRPRLSNLRGSGQIEEAADNVLFTYRPSVYDVREVDWNGNNIDTENLIFLILEKGRNCGVAKFYTRFYENIPTLRGRHYDYYGEQKRTTEDVF